MRYTHSCVYTRDDQQNEKHKTVNFITKVEKPPKHSTSKRKEEKERNRHEFPAYFGSLVLRVVSNVILFCVSVHSVYVGGMVANCASVLFVYVSGFAYMHECL